MESIWLEYVWALLILIGLEGLLSADNALVLAVIAKHLPEDQKKERLITEFLWHLFFGLELFCHFIYRQRLVDTGHRSRLSSVSRFEACHSGAVWET